MRWLLVALLCGCGGATSEPIAVEEDGAVVDTGVVDDEGVAETIDAPVEVAVEAAVDADAAPPPCAPGALVCEDFEGDALDAKVWKQELKNATLAIESAHGRRALHLRVAGPKVDVANEAFLHHRASLPVAGNRLFGRALVFVEKGLPDKNFILVEAVGPLADGTPARYGLGGLNSATDGQLFRLVYHPGDYVERSTSRPPVGRWACWEWELDGANDVMRVWLDGRDTPEARAVDEKPAWIAPEFRDIAVGFRIPHPDSRAAHDVYLDDVVIGTKRPGCPK